jgi:hypothetical protein
MNGKFTKRELEKFLHIFNMVTTGWSDRDALIPFSDEVANFPDDLDHLVEEFLFGKKDRFFSDFESQSIWESGKTIQEFKVWLIKKLAKRKGKK